MRPRARDGNACRAFAWSSVGLLAAMAIGEPLAADNVPSVIERSKPAIVAIGSYEPTRSPAFVFRGTGFAVDDGSLVVTNAHVTAPDVNAARLETLGVMVPASGTTKQRFVAANLVAVDPGADLALLKLAGPPLPALTLGNSDDAREGQVVLFTGFPIGAALGLYPTTHRGMIAAITPIAIPQGRSGDLNPKLIRRLTSGPFRVFQLDATAYPGNSGSPVLDPETGHVIGVINMVLVRGTKESVLSQPSGITYAIPSSHLRSMLAGLR